MSSSSSVPNDSLSQFKDLFDAALREYRQKTGKDIATEPLTTDLLHCNSSDAVLGILREQARAFNQFRNGDWRVQLMRRLKPTVDILLGLSTSGIFGESIGLVRIKLTYPLEKLIIYLAEISASASDICRCWSPTCSTYTFGDLHGSAVLTRTLKAAKGVSTSYDALVELFECFEHYLSRIKVLTDIPSAVGEILVKIMVELLEVLALAMQQIKQGRFSEFILTDTSHAA